MLIPKWAWSARHMQGTLPHEQFGLNKPPYKNCILSSLPKILHQLLVISQKLGKLELAILPPKLGKLKLVILPWAKVK